MHARNEHGVEASMYLSSLPRCSRTRAKPTIFFGRYTTFGDELCLTPYPWIMSNVVYWVITAKWPIRSAYFLVVVETSRRGQYWIAESCAQRLARLATPAGTATRTNLPNKDRNTATPIGFSNVGKVLWFASFAISKLRKKFLKWRFQIINSHDADDLPHDTLENTIWVKFLSNGPESCEMLFK